MTLIFKLTLVLGTTAITSLSDRDTRNYGKCEPLQFLSFNAKDIIECSFSDFYGVYWYNSTDSTGNSPFVALEDSKKKGDGYLSGQYDVYPNGSLVTNTVSLKDNHNFRVILLKEKRGSIITFDIRVYVVVKSNQPHPFIDVCGNESFCFTKIYGQRNLACVVSESIPIANLTWVVRNVSGDWAIPFKTYVSSDGQLYTTQIQTEVSFEDNEYSMLLVCKMVSPPDVVSDHEASVLIESQQSIYPLKDTVAVNVQMRKQLMLTCDIDGGGFLTWKRERANGNWETIADVYFSKRKIYDQEFHLTKNGSLVVNEVDIDKEGIYVCRGSTIETVKSFQVTLFVSPVPPYVIIQGCESHETCTLTVSDEGTLVCSLRGVRPQAILQWLPYPDSSSKSLTFMDNNAVFVNTSDAFDIYLISKFRRNDGSKTNLTVICRVTEWDYKPVHMDVTVELQFMNGQQGEQEQHIVIWVWIGASAGILIGVALTILSLKIYRLKKLKRGERIPNGDEDMNNQMNHTKV